MRSAWAFVWCSAAASQRGRGSAQLAVMGRLGGRPSSRAAARRRSTTVTDIDVALWFSRRSPVRVPRPSLGAVADVVGLALAAVAVVSFLIGRGAGCSA